jgi:hypothetical protein
MLHFTPPHPPVSYQEPMTPDQVEQVRPRRLAVSGRAVATPGNYQLRVDVIAQSFSQTRAVHVRSFDHNLGISRVVFSSVTPVDAVNSSSPGGGELSAWEYKKLYFSFVDSYLHTSVIVHLVIQERQAVLRIIPI